MDKHLITIIIPVYGVEQYLRTCLESIIRQTYSHFECICIDDGSPDGSYLILDEYSRRDTRFQVVRTPNRGVSATRNEGLDRARGQYICFVDSDDFVHPRYLELLYRDLTTHDVDIACCGHQRVAEAASYESIEAFPIFGNTVSEVSSSPILSLFQKRELVNVVVWNKLFKAEIARSVRFSEELLSAEDDLYTYQTLCSAKSMSCNPAPLVAYRDRPGSSTKSIKVEDRFRFAQALARFTQTVDGLSGHELVRLRKKAMNILYREIVKFPIRLASEPSVSLLMRCREMLAEANAQGLVDWRYLSFQYRLICWLLLIGRTGLVVWLVRGGLFNWTYWRQTMKAR